MSQIFPGSASLLAWPLSSLAPWLSPLPSLLALALRACPVAGSLLLLLASLGFSSLPGVLISLGSLGDALEVPKHGR
jgi:hypothetical protein